MKCPVCGKHLIPVVIPHQNRTVERGIRCLEPLCAFNFSDQECKVCGGEVKAVTLDDSSMYNLTCVKGHPWSIRMTGWVPW